MLWVENMASLCLPWPLPVCSAPLPVSRGPSLGDDIQLLPHRTLVNRRGVVSSPYEVTSF